jgi:hypothetical protein
MWCEWVYWISSIFNHKIRCNIWIIGLEACKIHQIIFSKWLGSLVEAVARLAKWFFVKVKVHFSIGKLDTKSAATNKIDNPLRSATYNQFLRSQAMPLYIACHSSHQPQNFRTGLPSRWALLTFWRLVHAWQMSNFQQHECAGILWIYAVQWTRKSDAIQKMKSPGWQCSVLPGIIVKTLDFWESDFYHRVADDSQRSLFWVSEHVKFADNKIDPCSEKTKKRYHDAGMHSCASHYPQATESNE